MLFVVCVDRGQNYVDKYVKVDDHEYDEKYGVSTV